jgi:magnesium transporter
MSTDRNEHTLFKKINNLVKKRRSALGQVPGTLIHVGERKVQKVKLTVIDFDEKNYTEEVIGSVEQCYPYISRPTVTWLNIDGLHDTMIFQKLGEHFNIHPLVLEDILTWKITS